MATSPTGFMQLHSMLSKHPRQGRRADRHQGAGQGLSAAARGSLRRGAGGLRGRQVRRGHSRGHAKRCKLRPDWELGALLQAQLLQQKDSTAKAIEYLQGFLQTYPKAREVRANYARLLINNKQLKEARAQYQILLDEQPTNADIVVTIGLLSLQMSEFDTAETALKRGLELGYRDPDTLRFYIGQVYEERKRYDEAMKWYAQVDRRRPVRAGAGALCVPARAAEQAGGGARVPAERAGPERRAARAC